MRRNYVSLLKTVDSLNEWQRQKTTFLILLILFNIKFTFERLSLRIKPYLKYRFSQFSRNNDIIFLEFVDVFIRCIYNNFDQWNISSNPNGFNSCINCIWKVIEEGFRMVNFYIQKARVLLYAYIITCAYSWTYAQQLTPCDFRPKFVDAHALSPLFLLQLLWLDHHYYWWVRANFRVRLVLYISDKYESRKKWCAKMCLGLNFNN